MTTSLTRWLACTLAVLGLVASRADSADQAAEEKALRQCIQSYTDAFNKKDPKALAAHWGPEATYIEHDTGKSVTGREAIEKLFTANLEKYKDATLKVEIVTIRFLSPGVAVETGTSVIERPKAAPDKSAYTSIHVKRDGKWYLDSITEDEVPEAVSNYEKLKELEWLVGDWVEGGEGAAIETQFKWSRNRNFLIRTFIMAFDGETATSGVQIVGWDPTLKQIRSWVFDAEGGFGEGLWTKKGDQWYIQIKDTLQNGEKASSTNIISPVDKDSFTWQSIDRVSSGKLLPSISETKVVRKAETPK